LLKIIRILLSSIVFLLFILSFFLTEKIFIQIAGVLSSSQFVPAFIGALGLNVFSIVAVISIVLLTFFFGRIYCAFICPLGLTQDIFIFLSVKLTKKKFKYFEPFDFVKYLIVIVLLIFFILGNMIFVNLLDPYSIFSRIITDILNPLFTVTNNFFSSILETFKIFILPPLELHKISKIVVSTSVFFLVSIFFISVFKGRFYCNQICPVGIILGFLSKFSFFKIVLDKTKCTGCGICEKKCSSGCIDIKNRTVNQVNCVRCMECLQVCPVNALNYKIEKTEITDNTARKGFFEKSAKSIFVALLVTSFPFKLLSNKIMRNNLNLKKIPIIPPGAVSIEHFVKNCTGCNLCVNKCPPKIIRPEAFSYGVKGILQPELDYVTGYCQYDCNICSQVCPSNAILPVSLKEKKQIQLGTVKFIKEKCIVITNNKDCGACAEHCPTKAVKMVDYKNNLRIPETDESICIGCGACEHMCPVRPERAIVITPNFVHKTAKLPETKKIIAPVKIENNDFPF
jgi:ferredoxin